MIESAYLRSLIAKAKNDIKTIVLPEGEDERILKAAHIITGEKAAKIIILGDVGEIKKYYEKNGWSLEDIELIDPKDSENLAQYTKLLYDLRKEKGMTEEEAAKLALNPNYFGTLMIKAGHADGMLSGANHSTADTVRPALQIIKSAKKGSSVSSLLILVHDDKPYVLSDCAIIIDPTDKEMADAALDAAVNAIKFGIEPKVAMLSFSTKGSGKGDQVEKVKRATEIAQQALQTDEYKHLNIKLDGELQADAALDAVVGAKKAPGSEVAGRANVLIFPDLASANISYKMLQRICGCEAYGPMLQGLNAPVNDLSRGALVEDIVGMIAITSIQSQK